MKLEKGTMVQLRAKTETGREVINLTGEIWVIRDITDTELILYNYRRDGDMIIARYDDKDFEIKP